MSGRYSKRKKAFMALYILGVLSGGILIVQVLMEDISAVKFASSDGMLFLPVIYVILLFAVSFTKPWWKYSGEITGTKVQTAGYLYTLIGVIIAMLQFSNEEYSIEQAIAPIGAALLTSLAGWFLGSFIGDEDPNGTPHAGGSIDDKYSYLKTFESEVKKSLKAIEDSLKSQLEQAEKLKKAQENYTNTVEQGTKKFETMSANIDPIKKAFESVKDLSSYLSGKDALENAKALPLGLKELNDNLKKASKNSEQVANLMHGIESLVDQYRKLMEQLEQIAVEWDSKR